MGDERCKKVFKTVTRKASFLEDMATVIAKSILVIIFNDNNSATIIETTESGEVRLDMEGISDSTDTQQGQSQGQPNQQRDPSRQGADALAILMPHLSKFGVFVLILLLKVLYSHRYGKLALVAKLSAKTVISSLGSCLFTD